MEVPSGKMEKKEVTVINSVTIGTITVIPVATVTTECRHGRRGTAYTGSVRPESVVIVMPSGNRAFRITGEEIGLEELIKERPGVATVLDGLHSGESKQ